MDFNGKRVLVTGGGQGIGLSIVKKFLELGAHVVVFDKNEKLIDSLRDVHGEKVTTVLVDLSNWDSTQAVVKSVLPIHHVINNVGILQTTCLLNVLGKDVDLLFNINFKTALAVSQVVATDWIERGLKGATIVNMSSVTDSGRGATNATENVGLYGCTKASITMLTKYLASELLPHGIRVNCIRPGPVNTEVVRQLPAELYEKLLKPTVGKLLYKELIEPGDVANTAAFLSSPMSYRMTGSVVTVDGGCDIQ